MNISWVFYMGLKNGNKEEMCLTICFNRCCNDHSGFRISDFYSADELARGHSSPGTPAK